MLETRRIAYQERLPRTMEALDRADIDELVNRKLEYDAMLNDIERNGDWLALANKYEFHCSVPFSSWIFLRTSSASGMSACSAGLDS